MVDLNPTIPISRNREREQKLAVATAVTEEKNKKKKEKKRKQFRKKFSSFAVLVRKKCAFNILFTAKSRICCNNQCSC
jgi:hypothetical protein